MKDKFRYKFELVNDVINSSVLSNPGIIVDTYYVKSNPVKIESIEVIKVDSIITKVRSHKSYDLKSHRIIVKKNDDDDENIIISDGSSINTVMNNKNICITISDNINNCFIESLNENCQSETIKYFDRGFIKNLLKRNPNIIINKIVESNCDWIITSNRIADELSKSDKYNIFADNDYSSLSKKIPYTKNITRSNRVILFSGKIGNTSIYTTDIVDDRFIYIGSSSMITSILNKEITVDNFYCGEIYDEGVEITFEYLFISTGIKKLIIE